MGKKFYGVYPADMNFSALLNDAKYPFGFVVNTDPMSKPGRHWQAIWCPNKNNIEYFDSFGDMPHKNLNNFLKKFKKITKTHKKLQDKYEISCGPYVIYFLIKRGMGTPFHNIINSLSKIKLNDTYVKLYLVNIIDGF